MRRLLITLCVLLSTAAAAQINPETVVVYGTLPSSDIGLSPVKVAGSLQSLSAQDLGAGHGQGILDGLGARASGVSLTDVQGNDLFQDLRYHGFAASPLQGTAQGIAVYQNGVRLNEAFGDTVNWDAIPQTAIARLDLWSSNPVFGLNALGGAVNMVMKDGFTSHGGEASVQGGSFGHMQGAATYGLQDGNFGFFVAVEGVRDPGWRLQSNSQVGRLYADAGWRFGDSEVHLVASGSQSGLGVIGPTPITLAGANSKAIFTWPQTTRNTTASIALNAKTPLAVHWQLEGNVYLRALRQRHVDGNDADFERCSNSSSFVGRLCLEDDAFTRPVPFTGAAALAFRNQFAILDQSGNPINFTAGTIYGTIDRTFTDATTRGGTLQVTSDASLGGFNNYLTIGASIDDSTLAFRSTSTLGRIRPDFAVVVDPALAGSGSIVHTNANLGYAPVTLAGATTYYGFYAVDALDLTDALTVTAGFRANAAGIVNRDRSGTAPELTGSHGYGRINPMAGATYKVWEGLTLFGGYSEANRAPTPLELDCASATLPCLLEGSLVADPPLAQVVTSTWQAGLRGAAPLFGGKLNWSTAFFNSEADNDIVALASTIQGRGYFTNVPATRRRGVDLSAQWALDNWSLSAGYSFLDATYQFTGTLASPNNPGANAAGNVTVTPGRQIPLNPAHNLRLSADVAVTDALSLGADLAFTGSQYYDGDNANQNARLPSRAVVNLRGSYAFSEKWSLFGLVNNVFDNHDPLYGSYFDPGNLTGLVTPTPTDQRTITLPQPISFQLGVSLRY